jgi:DNA polymerase-3 subunit gamma/tau
MEMTLLRMLAFRPAAVPTAPTQVPAAAGGGGTRASSGQAAAPAAAPRRAEAVRDVAPAVNLADWQNALAALDVQGAARQLAANCTFAGFDGDTLTLRLDERAQGLRTRQQEERLAQSLGRLLGKPVTLAFEVGAEAGETPVRVREREQRERQEQARQSLESDPTVQALRERFGAVIQSDSVKPVG